MANKCELTSKMELSAREVDFVYCSWLFTTFWHLTEQVDCGKVARKSSPDLGDQCRVGIALNSNVECNCLVCCVWCFLDTNQLTGFFVLSWSWIISDNTDRVMTGSTSSDNGLRLLSNDIRKNSDCYNTVWSRRLSGTKTALYFRTFLRC